MPPVGIDPITLTRATQTITELPKMTHRGRKGGRPGGSREHGI